VPPESRKRFKAALALLAAGESEALIFTKVDRASRCTEDFARLIRMSEEQGGGLSAITQPQQMAKHPHQTAATVPGIFRAVATPIRA